jgi:hypothetical protein
VAHRRREHRAPPELPEQHQHHAVDPRRRRRALVAHQLPACAQNYQVKTSFSKLIVSNSPCKSSAYTQEN